MVTIDVVEDNLDCAGPGNGMFLHVSCVQLVLAMVNRLDVVFVGIPDQDKPRRWKTVLQVPWNYNKITIEPVIRQMTSLRI